MIKKLLTQFFTCILLIFQTTNCKVVEPLDLLTPHKLSVMAKYIFAKQLELGIDSTWGPEIYYNHLKVWNNCAGDQGKYNIDDYITSFKKTLESLKTKGFDPNQSIIPVGKITLVDGEHRLAGSLLYDLPIHIKPSNHPGHIANATFFKQRGLQTEYLDAMALQYAELKENCYIVVLFPAARASKEQTINLLKKYGSIVYEKPLELTKNGPLNLIIELYPSEPWLGNYSNNFAGAYGKMKQCFPSNKPGNITIFLWQTDTFDNVIQCKKEIRALHKVENHSVHINDTHEETVQLSQLFFNKNSIHFLNNAQRKHFQNFERLFTWYSSWLKTSKFNKECFCIDSSAILSVYGLRDCGDLDFIHHKHSQLAHQFTGNNLVESNNNKFQYHTTTKDEIIFNPNYHFYYRGLKFASLEVIKNMKTKRNEPKDQKDVQLIQQIL